MLPLALLEILGPTLVPPGKPVQIKLHRAIKNSQATVRVSDAVAVRREWKLGPSQDRITFTPPKSWTGALVFSCHEKMGGHDFGTTGFALVDIANSWKENPRYGYVTDYAQDPERARESIRAMAKLGINAVQFYDWMPKHHDPEPRAAEWSELARRPVREATLRALIEESKKQRMGALAYNLIFGTYDNALGDGSGVQREWSLFEDAALTKPWVHPLPENWATPRLRLMDPGNAGWRDFFIGRMAKAIRQLGFTGWHVDQLGNPGKRFNARGEEVRLLEGFGQFLQQTRKEMPAADLIFNNVAAFGLAETAAAPVDALYIEVWDNAKTYLDVANLVLKARAMGKPCIIAGYINSTIQQKGPGDFNPDAFESMLATVLASGGWWLGPGDGGDWLCHEYFPNKNLALGGVSQEQLQRYTAFATLHQNILRHAMPVAGWTRLGESSVWMLQGKTWATFLNLDGMDKAAWRDLEGTFRSPAEASPRTLSIRSATIPEHVRWSTPEGDFWTAQILPVQRGPGWFSWKSPAWGRWALARWDEPGSWPAPTPPTAPPPPKTGGK